MIKKRKEQMFQLNTKIPEAQFIQLQALSNGVVVQDCPTCGATWNLNNQVLTDPIPPTTLASKLLKEAIQNAFDKAQFGGKD
tara:strand:- start:465 stop:710 length:246 start_codon:yes stop_codon:yes gene_type:complete